MRIAQLVTARKRSPSGQDEVRGRDETPERQARAEVDPGSGGTGASHPSHDHDVLRLHSQRPADHPWPPDASGRMRDADLRSEECGCFQPLRQREPVHTCRRWSASEGVVGQRVEQKLQSLLVLELRNGAGAVEGSDQASLQPTRRDSRLTRFGNREALG